MDKRTKMQTTILDSLPKNPHGRLLLAPRFGKSKLIISLIKRDKPKSILWVTPSAKLAEIDIPNEFDKWKAKSYKKKLTTVTYKSLSNVTGHYDMIILDEDQFVTELNLSTLLNHSLNFNYIIGMTGTDTKHQSKQDLYNQLNLEVIYNYNINEAVKDEILSDYIINVVKIPLNEDRNIEVKTKSGNTFYTSEKKQYEYFQNLYESTVIYGGNIKRAALNRMMFIQNSKSKFNVAKYILNNIQGKTLIFAPTKKLIEQLTPNFYHSSSKKDSYHNFLDGSIDILGLVQSGGVGYTFPELNNIILIQSDSDRTGNTTQKICRTLLNKEGKVANIYILCLEHTQDEIWIKSTLEAFDSNKINFITLNELVEQYDNK